MKGIWLCGLLITAQPAQHDRALVYEARDALRECYSRIVAIKVTYTERQRDSIPIPDDIFPARYQSPPVKAERTIEIIDAPGRRYERREFHAQSQNGTAQTNASRHFFDGATWTLLSDTQKGAIVRTQAPTLEPLSECPLHAFGWRYPHTLETSLDALFCEPENVVYKGQEQIGGAQTHVFEVTPLPRELRPDAPDVVRAKTVVSVWLDPALGFLPRRIRKAGIGAQPNRIQAYLATKQRDPSGAGRYLCWQYDVDSFREYADRRSGRKVPFPASVRLTVLGGGLGWTISDVEFNPPLDGVSFRPAIPEGYALNVDGQSVRSRRNTPQRASSSRERRTAEIATEARRLLESPAFARAMEPANAYSGWTFAALAGVALFLGGYYYWRHCQ